jgi:hypothetical protein
MKPLAGCRLSFLRGWECLRDLACNPFRGRMRCSIDPDQVSAGQPNDDEYIEQIKANGRDNEQVHGGDVRCVVTQEGAPSLGRRSISFDHILRNAGLTDLEAELEQLAMNARRSSARSSASIFGRPPRERDFHRQYRQKPARCQRTRVSGRMIVMALSTDGNHRYSMTKNKRSPFVSWTRPRTLRCSTIS